jgi:small GTP-binding protein
LFGNPNLKQPPLFEVERGLTRLREYARCEKETFDKLVLAIVGKEGVGKTLLTYRLMGMDAETERYLAFDRDAGGHESHRGETRGVHHEDWVIESTEDYTSHHDGRLQLIVWDYAGQSGYRGLHQCFFSRQAVYLLVFDLTKDAEESGRELCSWVRSIHSCVSGPVFCVVGTKLDKMRGRESEARLRYKRVIECLHEYRRLWKEALLKHVDDNGRHNCLSSLNELLHRDICLPAVPRRSSDVDTWLMDCKEAIGTVWQLRKALVDFIERQAKCVRDQLLLNDLCPLVHVAKAFIVDRVHATAAAVSGSSVGMDAMVGCVDRALTMAHDSGMRLWYNRNPVLSQCVFYDPRIVTELLRVLMEPIHLSREHDTTHLESQLPSTVVRDLMNGRMHVSAIDVLWKNFGYRHALKDDALRQTVINMLEQLNILTRDRDTVDVYMSMQLMRRFDFASQQRQSFVRSERMTTVV